MKKNWPIFSCTAAVIVTLLWCTASLNRTLTRPRYGEEIRLMGVSESLESISSSAKEIGDSAKSIDKNLSIITQQTLLEAIAPRR